MPPNLCSLIVATLLAIGSPVQAELPDFVTAVGIVEQFNKESVTITLADNRQKSFNLKITGTSNFSIYAPQVRAGKTIITQRKAEAIDLAKGQTIAVIYAEADKEYVLLNAVMKPVEKPGELGENEILEIAKAQVAKNDTWADRAEYTLTKDKDGWEVEVWRIPKVPGGVRYMSIDRKGNVLKYGRGL